jgi:Maltokinase N-terminal cap domain
MALIHRATLTPSKLELITAWRPARAWFPAGDLHQLGAYRFDDPAGEVGIEAFLLGSGEGPVVHVPLTYRAAPLEGADEYLVGTLEHSVLGRRWVYDGCGDPVWVTATATAVLTGGTQVEELVDTPEGPVRREPTARVTGSGTPGTPVPVVGAPTVRDEGPVTVVGAGGFEVVLVRRPGSGLDAQLDGGPTLTGRWAGGEAVLAGVRATVPGRPGPGAEPPRPGPAGAAGSAG